MTTDKIANMLTNIRNATKLFHSYTYCDNTRINRDILNILITENYITNYLITFSQKNKYILKIFLKYKGWWKQTPTFFILKRISKSGKRIYSTYKNLKQNNNIINITKGIAIISTSNGLMTHNTAIQLKKGGELLCYIE